MNKMYSILSSILVVIGPLIPITSAYYGVPNFGVLYLVIFIGGGLYITGVILGIIAFKRREKGVLKYVSVIAVIVAIFLVGYLN